MRRCVALFNDGWADWEAGFILAFLRESFEWSVAVATPTGGPAESIGGVRAAGDMAFADVDPDAFDLLLVIGSDAWSGAENADVTALLHAAARAGRPIGAICAATLAAARAGLLDGVAHTSNSLAFLQGAGSAYGGEDRYVDTPMAVRDGRLVTAPGAAPASFAVEVLRMVEPDRGKEIDAIAAMTAAEHAPARAGSTMRQDGIV